MFDIYDFIESIAAIILITIGTFAVVFTATIAFGGAFKLLGLAGVC